MERVVFVVERTGERIGCLLNPESLVVRRLAGVRSRQSVGGELTGARLADDPLLFTGGGRTELDLDLLFDVNLAGSSISTDDVRDLTWPLWALAENSPADDGYGRPPLVRLIWGKSWNVPGVVVAVAERLEQFTPEGAPRRSWLRMRLLRVGEPTARAAAPAPAVDSIASLAEGAEGLDISEQSVGVHEILGGEEIEGGTAERLDILAHRYYGAPWFWRLIASLNGIDDPLRLPPGLRLRIPLLSLLPRGAPR